ncbi:MAG: diaminopimelate epimerase DapF [Pseudomonadota bacterium]|jgi:diaminopimelate epimerase
MSELKFSKLHGCGNSFIVVDDRQSRIKNPSNLARRVTSAQFGIGADGLILLRTSKKHDLRMDYFNADGSTAEMCGNGIRCLAKFAADNKITRKKALSIETGAGAIRTELGRTRGEVSEVTVDMGLPAFRSSDVIAKRFPITDLKIGGRGYTFVSMGNPHAVTFVSDFDFDVAKAGRVVEYTARVFPHRVNVGFAQVRSRTTLQLKVWERGCGLTHACGTGACAAVVAATLHGKVRKSPIKVFVDGGILVIRWDDRTGRIFMTGPAAVVAEGTLRL